MQILTLNYTNNNSENIALNNSENIKQDSVVLDFLGIRLYKASLCLSGTEEPSQWLWALSVKFFIICSV